MSTDAIKTKIAALLAKAESTDNAHERDAFMAKVNELLEAYQLEMWEVRGTADPMGKTRGEARVSDTMGYGRDLTWAVARYYYAEAVFHGWDRITPTKRAYSINGRESCRVTTEIMLPFIFSQVRQQARTMAKEANGYSKDQCERFIANALISRVYRLIEARKAAAPTAAANEFAGKGLVLVDETQAYLTEQYPEMKLVKPRKLVSTTSAREAAERVSLHHQATAKKTARLA